MSQIAFISNRPAHLSSRASASSETGHDDRERAGSVRERDDRGQQWSEIWRDCNRKENGDENSRASGTSGSWARPDNRQPADEAGVSTPDSADGTNVKSDPDSPVGSGEGSISGSGPGPEGGRVPDTDQTAKKEDGPDDDQVSGVSEQQDGSVLRNTPVASGQDTVLHQGESEGRLSGGFLSSHSATGESSTVHQTTGQGSTVSQATGQGEAAGGSALTGSPRPAGTVLQPGPWDAAISAASTSAFASGATLEAGTATPAVASNSGIPSHPDILPAPANSSHPGISTNPDISATRGILSTPGISSIPGIPSNSGISSNPVAVAAASIESQNTIGSRTLAQTPGVAGSADNGSVTGLSGNGHGDGQILDRQLAVLQGIGGGQGGNAAGPESSSLLRALAMKLEAARREGQESPSGTLGINGNDAQSIWEQKFRALFNRNTGSVQTNTPVRHENQIINANERLDAPEGSGNSGTIVNLSSAGDTVTKPVESMMPISGSSGEFTSKWDSSGLDWEKIKMEVAAFKDETDERREAALHLTQMGKMTLTSADIRREVMPGLTRMIQLVRDAESNRSEAWQNHRIQIADGSNLRISTREVDGVLQLKMGTSNPELNRLLQQHVQEIREHLEKECEISVELQLDSGQTDGFDRFFGHSGQKEGNPHYRPASDEWARPVSVDKVAPQAVRNFGYNQMEWTI